MKDFLKLLLGSSLFLLERSDRTKDVRDRAARKIDDLRDVVQQKYEDAADRVAKASRAIRGQDHHVLGNALRLAAGIGIGIGVGLLVAPASGQGNSERDSRKRSAVRQQSPKTGFLRACSGNR